MTFFCMAMFVFLVLWRPQEWLFPWLYGIPLLVGIFAVSLFSLFLELQEGTLHPPHRRPPQYILLVGLFFAALMSHVSKFYLAGTLWTIEPIARITVFTMVLMASMDRTDRLRKMIVIIVLMAGFMAIHCHLQQRRGYGFAGGYPLYIPPIRGNPAQLRSQFFGIFGDPNDTAQMLAAAVPFSFVIFRRRNFFTWLIGVGLTVLLITATLATHSRGGMVGLAAALAVMGAMILPARLTPWVLGGFALAGLLITPLAGPWLEATPYTYDRIDFWAQANWVFKQQPTFGVGYGMFAEMVTGAQTAHNAFVLCYTELGLFGYWFWYGLLQVSVVAAWRVRIALRFPENEEQDYLRRFSGAALASIVGFAASGYFLSRTFVFPLFILFGILGALYLLAERTLPEDAPPLLDFRHDALLWGTFGTVASVLYIYVSILLVNRVYFG